MYCRVEFEEMRGDGLVVWIMEGREQVNLYRLIERKAL
jgi:hypothetical protein